MVPRHVTKTIRRFKEALSKNKFPACDVYLFGSYARGDARKDSDIDLCLVSPAFDKNKERYRMRATMIAFDIDPKIEIVISSPEHFFHDELSPLFSHIRKEALAA